MPSQSEKANQFRSLHQRAGAFVIPNPYDIGTARLLAHLGFEALATTSAGFAFTRGRPDGGVTRAETMEHARLIVEATDLPVSADLEGGFGDAPKDTAETIRQAAEAGLVGGSIEDSTGRKDDPIYPHPLAVERVRAAVEMARTLPFHFTLTARSENFLWGRPDLADTISRLQAFQEAGADVLYAPGLKTREEITQYPGRHSGDAWCRRTRRDRGQAHQRRRRLGARRARRLPRGRARDQGEGDVRLHRHGGADARGQRHLRGVGKELKNQSDCATKSSPPGSEQAAPSDFMARPRSAPTRSAMCHRAAGTRPPRR